MKKYIIGLASVLACAGIIATNVSASSVIVVTPSNPQGFNTADTRPGGAVTFVADATSPLPTGALQLTTDATTTSKAQYMHDANIPLSQVTQLAYQTRQLSGPAFADPSYQLVVDLNGGTLADGGFTTFVYEPYQNGTVIPNVWQTWDVANGQMWSSRTFSDGANCSVTAGAGGAPFYTLSDLKTNCPNAVTIGFGVNIGSNNPSYIVNTDALVFNDTTYNFELDPVVSPTPTATITPTASPSPTPNVINSKDECKKDGWKNFTHPEFKNQGECVAYYNHQ